MTKSYEQQRQEKITQNKKRLIELGIAERAATKKVARRDRCCDNLGCLISTLSWPRGCRCMYLSKGRFAKNSLFMQSCSTQEGFNRSYALGPSKVYLLLSMLLGDSGN